MSLTWSPEEEPEFPPVRGMGWVRIGLRAVPMFVVLSAGVLIMALLRLIERPLYGMKRPITPYITQAVCRLFLRILGIRFKTEGEIMRHRGGIVANHASWLDIFVLNARKNIYFVSKSEVANWPGIGILARITGTLFIARDPKQARTQTEMFETRLRAGHKLLFFPEGTSTDGYRVLPFKTTLFQAFFDPDMAGSDLHIQPVTVVYHAPEGAHPVFYGWWGDMSFGSHLFRTLAAPRHGAATVTYHPPLRVAESAGRKALALAAEEAVRAGMPEERRQAG